jgi:hypothetical protein
MLETRLRAEVGDKISILQHGSLANKGTQETILSIRLLQEINGPGLQACSIDLSKAYNRVPRNILWKKLEHMGVSRELIKAIKSTYSHCYESIKIGDTSLESFSLKNGLKQGSVLSPFLFIIYIDDMIKTLQSTGQGANLPGFGKYGKVPCIMFVDDVLITADSTEGLMILLNTMCSYAISEGLIINLKKSSALTDDNHEEMTKFWEDHPLPLTLESAVVYLGARLSLSNKSPFKHITTRIAKARRAVDELRNRGLNLYSAGMKTIQNISNSIIIPTITYSLESTTITQNDYEFVDKEAANLLLVFDTIPPNTATGWALFEYGIDPPSLIIQRNKLLADHRTGDSRCLTHHLVLALDRTQMGRGNESHMSRLGHNR